MNLLHALQDLAQQYLEGEVDIEGLEYALGDLAVPISKAGDAEASAFDGLLWLLLSEFGRGDRSETSVRKEIRAALPLRPRAV